MGCKNIGEQLSKVFGVEINKDAVRRISANHALSGKGGHGPSWLTVIAHANDSLRRIGLLRCESISLQCYWVKAAVDVFTPRITGFGHQRGDLDGAIVCRIFNDARRGGTLPGGVSTDYDPLFRFHRLPANPRIPDIEEGKTVPHTPWSHPFVERVFVALRRELLDHVYFWNGIDRELHTFRDYHNQFRGHAKLGGETPAFAGGHVADILTDLRWCRWETHCHRQFQLRVVG